MTRRTLVALALLFAGCVAEDFFWTGPRTDAYDFEGLPAERLEERELEAPTGERVAALWIAPPDPAAPVVLFLHGAGTNLERSVPRLEALVALEVGVFAIDYRGFGRSEGDASERRSYEDGDLAWATLVVSSRRVRKKTATQRQLYAISRARWQPAHAADAARRPVELP